MHLDLLFGIGLQSVKNLSILLYIHKYIMCVLTNPLGRHVGRHLGRHFR